MMRKYLVLTLILGAVPLLAQPSINDGGVVNAASNAPPGLPNGAIAQGSLFIVYGANLGPAALAEAGYPIPATLANTSVQVTVNGTSVAAPVFYTSAGQVGAIMPSTVPAGTGTITVSYNGQMSASAPVQVATSQVGLFTLNQGGTGYAVLTRSENNNNVVITPSNPAHPGDTLVLWSTGLGPITAPDNVAPPGGSLSAPVTVYVGAQTADVVYHGRSPCCAGLDQINFVVPAGLSGCAVSLAVVTNNTPSNFTSIPIASSGTNCSAGSTALDAAYEQFVQAGTDVRVGSVALFQISESITTAGVSQPFSVDEGSASFQKYRFAGLGTTPPTFVSTSFGGCIVSTLNGSTTSIPTPNIVGLDAGPQITVTGPGGTKELKPTASVKGDYSAMLSAQGGPAYLTAGSYSYSGSGGADVGAFQGQLQLPQPLTWTNASSFSTIDRSQSITLTWTGGDPTGYVYIEGSSSAPGTSGVNASFVCVAPTSAGHFTVLSYVLEALPATGSDITAAPGSLGIFSFSTPVTFTAPGLDFGFATSGTFDSQSATYR